MQVGNIKNKRDMKYTFKNIVCGLALASALVLGFSCTEGEESHERYQLMFADDVEIFYPESWESRVEYDASSNMFIPLYLGCEPLDLDYEYYFRDGYEINTDNWEWYSNDETVAVVDADGIVYPTGAGSTQICIKAVACQEGSDQYDYINITVYETLIKATEITVSGTNYTFEGGCNLTLTGEVTATATDPYFGSDVTYHNVTWYSSNPTVADIDPLTGVITTGYIPGGLTSIWIDFYAVAVDGSGTEGKMAVELRSATPPTEVFFDATTLGYNGKRFALHHDGFTIDYTMTPAQGTPNLINWVSSDPDAVSVEADANGETATVTFLGFTNSVTITATCEFTGFSQEITFSIPAGYLHESFGDYDTWDFGGGPCTDTENLGDQWWNEEEQCISRIAYDTSTSSNGVYTYQCRSDCACNSRDQIGFNSTYPLFGIRMWDVAQYDYVGDRSLFINWAWYETMDDYEEGICTDTYRANEYTHYYKLNDATGNNVQQFVIWDMSETQLMGQFAWYPSGDNYIFSNTFNIRYQDLKMADQSTEPSSDIFPFRFNIYEMQTFQSFDELESYITDELGMTYTKEVVE